jgi:hypothetical protein
MKRFLLGLATGGLLVGALWAGIHLQHRLEFRQMDAIENVAKGAINSGLKGAEFIQIAQCYEMPISGLDLASARRKAKQFEAQVLYRRNNHVKRMRLPIFLEDGAYITPDAGVLERLDSNAQVE